MVHDILALFEALGYTLGAHPWVRLLNFRVISCPAVSSISIFTLTCTGF